MTYPSFITLPFRKNGNAPNGADNSDQYPESLPEYCLEAFTKKGARVLDPFIGFGTTAFICEAMGRVPYGVEADGERFEWTAGQIEHWQNIRHGDSADIAVFDFPKMDFCITSPPFMPITDQWNPLYGGAPEHAGYDAYLKRMEYIFVQVAAQMKRGALVAVHADNINAKRFTPLVRDMSQAISKSLRPEADIIVQWDDAPDDYTYTHCLIFKKT